MRTKVEIENYSEKMKDKVTRLTETTKEEMMRTEVEIKTKTGETAETTTENIVRLIRKLLRLSRRRWEQTITVLFA